MCLPKVQDGYLDNIADELILVSSIFFLKIEPLPGMFPSI